MKVGEKVLKCILECCIRLKRPSNWPPYLTEKRMKSPLIWCLGWVLLLKILSTASLVCQPSVQSTGFCLVACLLGGTSTSAIWNPAWIPGWLPERRQDSSSRPWISHLTLWRPLWGLVENHLGRNLRLKQSQVTKPGKQLEKPGSGVRRLLNSADFLRSAGNFPLYWQNYFHA